MGIFFSITCAALWSIAIILFKKASADLHPLLMNLCKNCIGALLMVPTVYFFSPFSFADVLTIDLLILALSGILGIGIADGLILKSLDMIGASRLAIVECTYAPMVILVAILGLGETLTVVQFLGIGLVILSVFLITPASDPEKSSRKSLRLGIVLGVIGILSMAVGITIVKPVFDRVDLLPIVLIRLAAGSFASLLILPVAGVRLSGLKKLSLLPKKFWFYSACVISTYISMMFWVAGFKYNDVSIASALNQTSTIFTVIFASWFLNEAITKKVFVAVCMAVSGVLMITL